jgi:hypothetical protein
MSTVLAKHYDNTQNPALQRLPLWHFQAGKIKLSWYVTPGTASGTELRVKLNDQN